jgi:tetratricopeptide (TPR) repeat protein
MLKDLDAQQQEPEAGKALPVSDPLPNDDQLGQKEKDPAQFWSVVSGFLVFFAILGGYYYWQFASDKTEAEVVEIKPSFDDVLLNSEVMAVLDKEADAVLLEKQEGREAIADFDNNLVSETSRKQNQVVELIEVPEQPVVAANVENHIQSLLEAGDKAYKADRLRTPKDDNAYDRYTAVLALQPDNEKAQQGLERIQQRYLGFIKSVIGKGQYYKVPDLVKKARDVGVQQSDIDSMLSKMPSQKSNPAKEVIKHLEEKKVVGVEAGNSAQSAVVEKSFNSRDLQMAQDAARNIEKGRMLLAEKQLKTFVAENAQSVFAFQKLFDLLLLQQRLPEAEAMIEKGSHLPGELFSYMVGQVLTRRGDLQGGLHALNSHSPSMEKLPGYYALKAGLLHKLDQNQDAIALYQKLISQDPKNPGYWLGLAVSMDAISASKTLPVFRQVYKIAPDNAPYLEYVEQRIQALDPTLNAGDNS